MSITLSEFHYGVSSILHLCYGLETTHCEERKDGRYLVTATEDGGKLALKVRCPCGKRAATTWERSPLAKWPVGDAMWQIGCMAREMHDWIDACKAGHEKAVA